MYPIYKIKMIYIKHKPKEGNRHLTQEYKQGKEQDANCSQANGGGRGPAPPAGRCGIAVAYSHSQVVNGKGALLVRYLELNHMYAGIHNRFLHQVGFVACGNEERQLLCLIYIRNIFPSIPLTLLFSLDSDHVRDPRSISPGPLPGVQM